VPDCASFVQYRTGFDIGILFQSSKRLTVPRILAIWRFKKLYEGFKGYSLHVYTADGRKANTLDVQIAGDEKAYTPHVHIASGRKVYTLYIYTAGGGYGCTLHIHTSNCGKA